MHIKVMPNTCLMYPNSSTALIVGRRLLREEHSLTLYIPGQVHRRMANSIPLDLEIASVGLNDVSVKETADLSDIPTMDFIIFGSLDVCPDKTLAEFAHILAKLFR